MLGKKFEIQVLDNSLAKKWKISEEYLVSDISFTENLGWGQGELTIRLVAPFDYAEFVNWDIIQVYGNGSRFNGRHLLYMGTINTIRRKHTISGTEIEYSVLPISAMLTDFIYKEWTDPVFNKNQNIVTTIQDVVSKFNSEYAIDFTLDCDSTSTVENIGFNFHDSLKALNICWDLLWRWVFVWPDRVIHIKETPTHHYLYLDKHIDSTEYEEKREGLTNRIYAMFRWTELFWLSTYIERRETLIEEDATSISTYGLREAYWDSWVYAISLGSTYDDSPVRLAAQKQLTLLANSYQKNLKSVVVNDTYNIESIHPWDLITIKNIEIPVEWLQVKKISYNMDSITLEFDFESSIAETFQKATQLTQARWLLNPS